MESSNGVSRLHLWAIEDVWGVLVEDDRLPVEVAGTGHRQEGQEEEGDHGEGGEHQNGVARQLCRIRTGGAGAPQDWFALLGCRRHKGCLGWWWALRVECGGGDYLPEINPMPGLNPVPMPGLNPNA